MEIIDKLATMLSGITPIAKTCITPETAHFRRKILQTRLDNLRANIQFQYNEIPQSLRTPADLLLQFRDHPDYMLVVEIYVVLQQMQYIDVAVGNVIEYFDVNY